MRAIVIREPGGPDVLTVRDVPEPDPPHGYIRVRVSHAGVNRADLMQRAGRYPAPPGAPADIPGLEYAGTVDAVGPNARRFREGDRVFGLVAGGAYADKLIVHEREAAAVPEGLSDEQAAAVPEAFLTAYDALVVRARLEPGERVLIHAAGSGVGTAGIQIAKALGCFVVGTSRTPDKLDRCRELGMHEGIVPKAGALAEEVRRVTGGAGVDVVLDLVGGDTLRDTLGACAPLARIALVGLVAGGRTELNLSEILSRRLTLVGTVMRARPLEEKIEAAKLLTRTLCPWLAAGLVRPVVDRVFPLDDAAGAHAYVAENTSFGKVLLRADA